MTTGTLTVNTVIKNIKNSDSFTDLIGEGYYQFTYYFDSNYYIQGASVKALCNIFPKIGITQRGTVSGLVSYSGDRGYRFALKSDFGITTVDQFKEYITDHPLYVTVELSTPVTYQLTATEVAALLGQNNIWADCGPVSVDYPADTKLYIQKINAPADDNMTADTQIASGKYFIIGNNLYLSTTTILAGDTIIPGTNCQKTNLAAALNALNA